MSVEAPLPRLKPARHLEGLEQRLGERHARLLGVRSGVVLVIAILLGLAIFEVEGRWTLVAAFALFAVFLGLVAVHRRVNRMRGLIASRLKVEGRRAALARLDWDALPPAAGLAVGAESDLNARAFIADLNLTGERSLSRLLDHTFSDGGRARLWARLTASRPGLAEIIRRQEFTRELLSARGLRLGLLTRLGTLDTETEKGFSTSRLHELGGMKFSERRGVAFLLPLAGVQLLMLVGLGFAATGEGRPWMAIPLALVIAGNLYWRGKIDSGKAYRWSLAAGLELDRFREAVGCLERFAGIAKPRLRETLAVFRGERAASARLARLDAYGGRLGVRQNFLVQLLVNLVWPWDLWWTQRLDAVRAEIHSELPRWIDALAEIEAGVSLAMYSESLDDACWPRFHADEGAALEARDLRHPLLLPGEAVGNDLELGALVRTLLLTGSNMSGKSTFLRTVGANFLLARAGARVLARELRARDLELWTSLSAADSLQEGLSSFYAEVIRLKSILTRAEAGQPVLFLIDEIFRGTNNRERLLGSRAFIEALARTGAFGIVSSHDLELAQLEELGLGVVNAHFRESIRDGRMSFTYRLQPGPCPTTNALEVMRGAGLPVP